MTRSAISRSAGYYYSLVGKKLWMLGSASDCTIVFTDDLISSQHALLLATADRSIYFCDLQSVNGSFVNDQAVQVPVLLTHGDRLRLGSLELEFQYAGEVPAPQPERQKLVLLVQAHDHQTQIWQAILDTCGASVLTERITAPAFSHYIEDMLEGLGSPPDLLIADLEMLKPNPYEFCRYCREHYQSLKIILTSGSRTDIFSSERRWVQQQGAVDLLPGFSQESFFSLNLTDLVDRLDCLLQALDFPSSQLSSLEPLLRSRMQWLQTQTKNPSA